MGFELPCLIALVDDIFFSFCLPRKIKKKELNISEWYAKIPLDLRKMCFIKGRTFYLFYFGYFSSKLMFPLFLRPPDNFRILSVVVFRLSVVRL